MRVIGAPPVANMLICRHFTTWSRNPRHLRGRRWSISAASASIVAAPRTRGLGDDGEGQQGDVRGMLLSVQGAVRAAPGRAVRDLPPGQPRGPAPAAADALRLP